MKSYPKELIERITLYFKEKHDHYINTETAVEYLDSLAGLYVSFTEFLEVDTEKK